MTLSYSAFPPRGRVLLQGCNQRPAEWAPLPNLILSIISHRHHGGPRCLVMLKRSCLARNPQLVRVSRVGRRSCHATLIAHSGRSIFTANMLVQRWRSQGIILHLCGGHRLRITTLHVVSHCQSLLTCPHLRSALEYYRVAPYNRVRYVGLRKNGFSAPRLSQLRNDADEFPPCEADAPIYHEAGNLRSIYGVRGC